MHPNWRVQAAGKVHHICKSDDKDGLDCESVLRPLKPMQTCKTIKSRLITFFSLFFLVFSGSLTSPMKGFARRGASLLGAGRCTPGRATLGRVLKSTEVDIAEMEAILISLILDLGNYAGDEAAAQNYLKELDLLGRP